MFSARLYLLSAIAVVISAVAAIPAPAAAPVLPQRNATDGTRVGSHSSANNTAANRPAKNVTINNHTITGTNGAQAACDRGHTEWCTAAPVVPVVPVVPVIPPAAPVVRREAYAVDEYFD
ncbi:hypothetical protein BDW22DRAFT_1345735 [Trametopsis cervina]|nr:hypothetical protein BDW22DRAFT_1345735 [Trametopsis cervina]